MTTNQEKRATNFPLEEILSSLYFKNTAACKDSTRYKWTAIPKIHRKSDQESCRRDLKSRTYHQGSSLMLPEAEKQLPGILQQHLNRAAVECSKTIPAQRLPASLKTQRKRSTPCSSFWGTICSCAIYLLFPFVDFLGTPSIFTTGHKQIRLLQNQVFSSSTLLRRLFHQMIPSLPSLLSSKGLKLPGPFML